ncbi:tetratricopeptide repeat protein [Sandaracinobacter sp. RS1-74]|uniref:tetratricopeptide repeat protein n=1 Tax=Sandaracinobacteroides sayramensis TaxID=2913411 RepID=UPI001EDA5DF1|nr:tetratricopeptide repeat protein [Sandaracinobacteroides sayramensis]MCG2839598.1 tetratricopeptide repeat protein [Sandaracinobacteroides sayramensis]
MATALPMAGVPLLSGAAMAQALSPAVGKPLQQASNAAKAGNNSAALNYVNQARTAAKTPTERTKVAQMAAFVHTRSGQYAQAAAELERINAPASQLAPLYYQARQYDKAIATARKSGQTTIVAQSYLQQGKPAEAAKIYQDMLAKNPNNLSALQNLAGAQFKMGDKKAYIGTIQKLIRLDPTPARWRALLVDMKNQPQSRDSKLALYHLMRETGNLTTAADVQEFAKVAIVGGQSGVAADVVKTASASGVIPAGDATTARLIDAAGKRQSAALAAAPNAAKAPNTALAAGNAYLGAGQYPQAIAAFTTAQKGPNPGEAALFKGIAQLRAGNIAAAKATFAAVPNGPVSEVAGLWQLYASTKG